MKVENGVLLDVNDKDLQLLNTNPEQFWNGVKVIGKSAFSECKKLKKIVIPNNIIKIDDWAFSGCQNLENLTMSNSIAYIGDVAFKECSSLKTITMSRNLKHIGEAAFSECTSLQNIDLPDTVEEIGAQAFYLCKSLKKVKLSNNIEQIDDETFQGCSSLKEIEVPENVYAIYRDAFCGCTSLEKVIISDTLTSIDEDAFEYTEALKEIIVKKEDKLIHLYNPHMIDDFYNVIENANFYHKYLKSSIPTRTVDNLMGNKKLKKLKTFKFYKRLIDNLSNNEELKNKNLNDMINLGINIGLFSNEKLDVKTSSGEIVNKEVSELAYDVMYKMIKNGMPINKMHMHFQSMKPKEENTEFLKFLLNKTNLNEILEEENKNNGFITKVYEWFEERKNINISSNNYNENYPDKEENRYKLKVYEETPSGIYKLRWHVPTIANLRKEFSERKFFGVNFENKHIADVLSKYPQYDQKHFDKAVEIDEERKMLHTEDHILGVPFKQTIAQAWKEYFDDTEKIKNNILKYSNDTLVNQGEIADYIFTYEMLSKSDASNFAMGFLTSCCATLYGAGAGAQRAMIVSDNMQPLAIRDNRGEIIAFGLIYINKKEGYAVVNDFEVNVKYEDDIAKLKTIYDKAMSGVKSFVDTYNKQNKNNPIKIVTCGLSPNWGGINRFIESNPSSSILDAPNFDNFKYAGSGSWPGDWHNSQWVIYDTKKQQKAK